MAGSNNWLIRYECEACVFGVTSGFVIGVVSSIFIPLVAEVERVRE